MVFPFKRIGGTRCVPGQLSKVKYYECAIELKSSH